MDSDRDAQIVVTGAGGFVGGWLVAELLASGHRRVRSVDYEPLDRWHQLHPEAESLRLDLRETPACAAAVRGGRTVYHLAADMGGMGFIGRQLQGAPG